jgi:hypothetical protein
MVRWMSCVLVLAPLLVGAAAPCPEPNRPDIRACPFPVDSSLVVGTLLDWVRLEVGQKFTYTRTWCDPDGDPAEVEIVSGPEGVQIVNKPKTGAYTLLWLPRTPMTAAVVVRVTDKPAHGDPNSAIGTILVQVVPRGQRPAPRQCGGQPQ